MIRLKKNKKGCRNRAVRAGGVEIPSAKVRNGHPRKSSEKHSILSRERLDTL